MKTASSELFDLIQSLSSRERAYFKRFATMHKQSSDSTYLKLFDAIYEQEKYDEKALKEQFKNDNLSRYFARAKKYLYDKILESMRLFHAEASLSIQLKLQINSARFLYSKCLFKQAMKKVLFIKKEAEAAEYWAEYIAALEIETSIFARTGYVDVGYEDIVEKKNEGINALKQYIESYRHYCLKRQMVYLLGKGAISYHKEIERIFEESLQDSELQGISSQITRLDTLALYSENHAVNKQAAISYYEEAVELMESNPAIFRKGAGIYLFFVGRLLDLTMREVPYDMHEYYLQKIREHLLDNEFFWTENKITRYVVEVDYYFYKLLALFEYGKHNQAEKVLCEAFLQMETNIDKLHPDYQMRLPYMAMFIHFFQGQFDQALQYANAALDIPIDISPKVDKTELWLLFIHWELKNYDFLEHLIRNTVRSWRKRDLYDDWKRFMVEMLRKLLRCTCEKEIWTTICKKLETPNQGLPEEKYTRRWYTYAMSKLKNLPLKEMHLQLLQQQETSNETTLVTAV